MKNALSKPLLRMASAHSSSLNNGPHQPAHPLFNSRISSPFSSSSSSSSPYFYTSTIVSRPAHNNILFLKRNFSSKVYPEPVNYGFLSKGALALIGGAFLYLSTSTAEAFALPSFLSSKPTPASRMKERLDKHGYYEKLVVPDGNCQMRSISDQIHGNESKHQEVRSKIMSWLAKNEKFAVDDSGTATLGDFIDRDSFPRWASYIAYMSRNGAWGDHITLLAAAEVYGVNISIISNVDDGGSDQYVTVIKPRSSKPEKTLNLSHWHEMHYNSLYPVNPPVQAA